jgi:hypothetical protein
MERQIATMRRAWGGEQVVEGALRPIEPRPLQRGGPQILAGSLVAPAIERSARWADGICGFSFGPSVKEVAFSFDTARRAWRQAERPDPPRLVTCCWFALGKDGRQQMDVYLRRYLNFMGESVAVQLAPTVKTTSAAALRQVLRELEDIGTDELLLVPTTLDPEEVDRVADLIRG